MQTTHLSNKTSKISSRLATIAVFVCGLLLLNSGFAQNVWTGAAGTTNWSDPGNWSFSASPTPSDTVVFDNNPPPGAAAGVIDNIIDTSFTINNWLHQTASTNGNHLTLIPATLSLNISGT